MNLRALATLVRDEAERWAGDVGYEAETLLMQCAVCSVVFVAAAAVVGIEAEIANGFYLDDDSALKPHFWAFAWEPGARGIRLVDLTLTQYKPDAPRAAVFSFRDPEVKRYALLHYGDDARREISDVDELDAEQLEERVLARLHAALRAPAALEAATP